MSRIVNVDVGEKEKLCNICKALSVPDRIDILKLIESKGLSISEISEQLGIPQSSVTFHMKALEKADMISIEERPGMHGTMKLCTRKTDYINISAYEKNSDINHYQSCEMPIGAYYDFDVYPTCGLADENGIIGVEDRVDSFFLPARIGAGILWTSKGSVSYRFPNFLGNDSRPIKLMFTFEICSEALNYHEDWKSDITFRVNGLEVGTWQSGGDYGARRGRLNPPSWENGSTQYGVMVGIEIDENGTRINGRRYSDIRIDEVFAQPRKYIEFEICNKENAMYIGGFNLFGKKFGDYKQDIVMGLEYRNI